VRFYQLVITDKNRFWLTKFKSVWVRISLEVESNRTKKAAILNNFEASFYLEARWLGGYSKSILKFVLWLLSIPYLYILFLPITHKLMNTTYKDIANLIKLIEVEGIFLNIRLLLCQQYK
jgi:hypothetical protein